MGKRQATERELIHTGSEFTESVMSDARWRRIGNGARRTKAPQGKGIAGSLTCAACQAPAEPVAERRRAPLQGVSGRPRARQRQRQPQNG